MHYSLIVELRDVPSNFGKDCSCKIPDIRIYCRLLSEAPHQIALLAKLIPGPVFRMAVVQHRQVLLVQR